MSGGEPQGSLQPAQLQRQAQAFDPVRPPAPAASELSLSLGFCSQLIGCSVCTCSSSMPEGPPRDGLVAASWTPMCAGLSAKLVSSGAVADASAAAAAAAADVTAATVSVTAVLSVSDVSISAVGVGALTCSVGTAAGSLTASPAAALTAAGAPAAPVSRGERCSLTFILPKSSSRVASCSMGSSSM